MHHEKITRRGFLAAAVVAASLRRAGFGAQDVYTPNQHPSVPDQAPDVVQISSNFVVRGRRVHRTLLPEMIETALTRLTARPTAADAWRSLLRPDDVIGLKFNRSGAEALGTTEQFADAVIGSLRSAGFEERQIVAVETDAAVYKRHGVQRPAIAWQTAPTDFSSGTDRLAAWLDQVTAIINIPFLKTHNIAGLTCCLKNLSHALVKHPARFHQSHCSPYIADIVALPAIRNKLRLQLVNGLRVVFDHGPEPRDADTWDAGVVLAGTDPVAVDTVGLDIINSQRAILGLPVVDSPIRRTQYLREAARRGLGRADLDRIDLVKHRA